MTSYIPIFTRFLKKIKEDKEFLNYGDLPEEEQKELVADHLIDLLNQAVDEIYDNCNPEVDMYDKDDGLQQFNIDLVNREISLIINIMRQKYFEEDENKLKVFGAVFSNSELNVLSPAHERDSFINFLDGLRQENKRRISNYVNRNRATGELKGLGD